MSERVKVDVDGVPVVARERGDRTRWWLVTRSTARKLAGSRVPRTGYEIDVGRGSRPRGAYNRAGTWVLVNLAGRFELHFKYD